MMRIKKNRKAKIQINIRKTSSKNRNIYNYYCTDGSVYTIVQGEDGVTEADIKKLHSFDDSEVYFNNKNARPKRTDQEKFLIKHWKEKHVEKFKEEYGYELNEADLEYTLKEYLPRNYNVSIDYDVVEFDNSKIGVLSATEVDLEFEWSDEMTEVMQKMTHKQREIIRLMFVEELKQHEVAKKLEISSAAVSKHYRKARLIIEKHLKIIE